MYSNFYKDLKRRSNPIDIIVVGLGFMGFGFVSASKNIEGIRVPLVISRRPKESVKKLKAGGINAKVENNVNKIIKNAEKKIISVSSDLDLINNLSSDVVLEMTGTVDYGTEVALKTIEASKHIITMNPELQETVGTKLKKLADKKGVVISDVFGDQPGSIARLMNHAKAMGFKVLVAGNMKRYLDRHATQKLMQPWADDKGLAVRQTVSFTDGTKQSIEMCLVANYFGMDVTEFGMRGPQVEDVKDSLNKFNWDKIGEEGIVDYVIGKSLFPGVFVVVEHKDKNQAKYLRYLGLGEGPRYVLFEPYHLCHLEIVETVVNAVLYGEATINNGDKPKVRAIAVAKQELAPGDVLDGIGGDFVYGNIDKIEASKGYLPIGLAHGAKVKVGLHQDQPIKLSDVEIPNNAASRLLGFHAKTKTQKPRPQRFFKNMNFLGL